MSEHQIIDVDIEGEERIDRWFQTQIADISRTKLVHWIDGGAIKVNGEVVKKNFKVKSGDKVEFSDLPVNEPMVLEPENIPLNIVYEDEDLLVIHKPKNRVVHPGSGVKTGTLVAGLLHHCQNLSGVNGELRPGIVHRLDRDTSGLMVVAKNDIAHVYLADQLKERTLSRQYHCVVWGHPYPGEDTIDNVIGRDPRHRLKMKVQREGKRAITHYEVLDYFPSCALVRLNLQTGRTHQIRVHMQNLGHSILGDKLYGGDRSLLTRCEPLDKPLLAKALDIVNSQALMATSIKFIHPRTEELMSFELPFEGELKELVDLLREKGHEQRLRS